MPITALLPASAQPLQVGGVEVGHHGHRLRLLAAAPAARRSGARRGRRPAARPRSHPGHQVEATWWGRCGSSRRSGPRAAITCFGLGAPPGPPRVRAAAISSRISRGASASARARTGGGSHSRTGSWSRPRGRPSGPPRGSLRRAGERRAEDDKEERGGAPVRQRLAPRAHGRPQRLRSLASGRTERCAPRTRMRPLQPDEVHHGVHEHTHVRPPRLRVYGQQDHGGPRRSGWCQRVGGASGSPPRWRVSSPPGRHVPPSR